MAKPMYMRLPHGEADERKRYSMADPDACDEAYAAVRRWQFSEGEEPSREDFARVLAMADCYLHLTTYELGQEHCVRQLRDVWRARRAVKP